MPPWTNPRTLSWWLKGTVYSRRATSPAVTLRRSLPALPARATAAMSGRPSSGYLERFSTTLPDVSSTRTKVSDSPVGLSGSALASPLGGLPSPSLSSEARAARARTESIRARSTSALSAPSATPAVVAPIPATSRTSRAMVTANRRRRARRSRRSIVVSGTPGQPPLRSE